MLRRRGLPVLWVASSLALACSSGAGSGRSPDDGGAHDRQTGADAPVDDRGLDAGLGDGGVVDSGASSGGAGGAAPLPPSCAAPAGAALRCGQMKDSCCASPGIAGGSFHRNYDGITYSDMSHPATVSTFRLDRYEVTLARFRQFVSAVTAGWSPPPGSGKHAHLNGGAGLSGGTEPGWDPSWTGRLARTIADWTANLNAPCSSGDFVVTGTITPIGPTDLLTRGQAVFGAGDPSQTTLEGVSFDLFLARYTPAGALVWAKLAPGASASRHGVAPLPDGGAVVGAFFAFQPSGPRPAVFGPGEAGSITLTQLPGFASQSMLGWFRSDGTARTARIVAQGSFVAINDLTALADGSAIATGGFTAATTFGPLDPNPVMLVGPPSTSAGIVPMDMFLGSYPYPP